ncbi:hypothetical protein E8E11_009225 [Didymella keratinophila]|nr:hypothetical protein E8E11_009225 [Didymella keratinophila]
MVIGDIPPRKPPRHCPIPHSLRPYCISTNTPAAVPPHVQFKRWLSKIFKSPRRYDETLRVFAPDELRLIGPDDISESFTFAFPGLEPGQTWPKLGRATDARCYTVRAMRYLGIPDTHISFGFCDKWLFDNGCHIQRCTLSHTYPSIDAVVFILSVTDIEAEDNGFKLLWLPYRAWEREAPQWREGNPYPPRLVDPQNFDHPTQSNETMWNVLQAWDAHYKATQEARFRKLIPRDIIRPGEPRRSPAVNTTVVYPVNTLADRKAVKRVIYPAHYTDHPPEDFEEVLEEVGGKMVTVLKLKV